MDHRDPGSSCGLDIRKRPNRVPIDYDAAAVGLNNSPEHVDERRLAGAVLAEERKDLAGVDADAHS